MFQPFGNLE